MHCLLCHEKISKIRHWRTKSEFCCDEHAAIHRRQTLERLVGYVAPSRQDDYVLSILGKPAGARGEESDAPPLPTDAFGAAASPSAVDLAVAAWDAGAEESSEEESSLDAEWLPTGEEPAGEATEETELADYESADADFGDEDEQDEELVAEQPEDDRPYFEATSVQRDEPFPVEIQTAEADGDGDKRQMELTSAEPIEPGASADASDAAALLELLSPEPPDALTSAEVLDDGSSPVAELTEAKPEMADELAQAILERESSAAPEAAAEQASGQDGGKSGEPETQPLSQTPSEATHAEAPAAAIQEPVDAAAEPTNAAAGAEEAAPRPKAAAPAKPVTKSYGLKPVKTWDPSRGRSAGKKRMAGRGGAGGTGNADALSQLAEGLGERGSKARPGLGGEIRREGGRKSVMVCFLPVQGGNGASTVSLHVAEAISHHLNERVLLSDFDFHSGTLAFRLGLKPAHTLGDVFEWSQNKEQLWEKVVCRWKKLDVLVAPPSNSSIHPHSLDRLPDLFVSALERYPYVIVDHPDAIYSSSRHILMLSDLVYLVCTPEITSLHLARRKVQQIRAMGVPGERLRLIVNRAGSWGSLGVQDVGKIVGVPVSWALNNDYAALRDAVWNGGLVQDGSELSKQLRELGWSVMGVDAPVAAESAVTAEVGSSAG
jgi:MinD-like ATPase involved in chromosome partitioning or flagellar assembly